MGRVMGYTLLEDTVSYTYDSNGNVLTVTDWANRVTSYAYDENNRVVGVTKPDGSVTTTLYDNKQRVTFTTKLLPMSSALSKIQGDCTCNRLFIILHVIFISAFCYAFESFHKILLFKFCIFKIQTTLYQKQIYTIHTII